MSRQRTAAENACFSQAMIWAVIKQDFPMKLCAFLLIGLFLLAGCAAPAQIPQQTPTTPASEVDLSVPGDSLPSPTPAGSPTPGASPSPPAAPSPSPPTRPVLAILEANPTVEAITLLAEERLASKLGVENKVITVFNITEVDWPDESLGCPMGRQNYAQVITPGYRIELEVDKSIYTFHTDQSSRVILCTIEPPHEIFNPP